MQPYSVRVYRRAIRYRLAMAKTTTKTQIWANVQSLMTANYGAENLTRLARETKIGPGSASRIKAQETSVGVDVLEKIADHFKVEPWQLMAPEIGAARASDMTLSSDEVAVLLTYREHRQQRQPNVQPVYETQLIPSMLAPPDKRPQDSRLIGKKRIPLLNQSSKK